MKLKPQTRSGRWSVWLNAVFLTVIGVSMILVNGLGLLSYDDRWWDVAASVFIAGVAAFITGMIAIFKNKESSVLVRASVIIGLLTVLFLLLHSLFISD